MLQPPEIQYLRNGDVSLAYQIVGDGPIDVVEVPGVFMHLEMKWELPPIVRFLEALTRFARVITFDRRGLGLSDRLDSDGAPTLAEHVDDVRAVMDATGSRAAAILGVADGGPTAIGFAANHPERTRALVLYGTIPCMRRDTTFPQGWDDAAAATMLDAVEHGWGRGVMAAIMRAEDMRPLFARCERRACTPRAATAYMRAMLDVDARPFLAAIEAPTLVMHFRDHPTFPVEGARTMAECIRGASYVEVDHEYTAEVMFARTYLLADMERFLTGAASVHDADRVLAAVLFTDIVGSTERAAALGDRRWRDLLDEHDRRARAAVERAGGRVVKNTGDGLLATFDGAVRAVRCAQALVAEAGDLGLGLRAGVHVGECERRGDDLAGMTVHVAARVAALADGDEILVTSTLRDALVGTDVCFEPRHARELRGVPGRWELFVVR